MTNSLAKPTTSNAVTMGYDTAEGFALMQRVANVLSQSTIVPKAYQDNLADCMVALNMAQRMNADPLMVMQNLHIIQGRPSFGSSFLISTFNASGKFTPLKFEFKGEKKDLSDAGCRATATELQTGEKLEGSWVTMEMAKAEGWYSKSGSKWKTMPQQMLMYRAAAFFIRVYAPEIMMGMQTTEETHDIIDVTATAYEERDQDIASTERKVLDFTEGATETEADQEEEPTPEAEEPPIDIAPPQETDASQQQLPNF